ncbi:DUF4168 domain-containing protein [Croceicoccus marinus]|nr:DUF4168 domain-containing protein [Croceicoccus marinus]
MHACLNFAPIDARDDRSDIENGRLCQDLPSRPDDKEFDEMKKLILIAAMTTAAAAAPAIAQDATDHAGHAMGAQAAEAPAAPATATPAPAMAQITDAEVDSYAAAMVDIQKIDADAAMAAEEKQTQMVATVSEQGLTPQRFNEITTQVQSDPELQQRVQLAMSELMAPAG